MEGEEWGQENDENAETRKQERRRWNEIIADLESVSMVPILDITCVVIIV